MKDIKVFRKTICGYYKTHRRFFPWRETQDPYKIWVSEIMLQQTQADRVVRKYEDFIKKFKDFESLSKASIRELLEMWKGLGYNRRALNMKRTAEKVVADFGGSLPRDREKLLELPGIGPATAGDIRAFAWNIADTVIETNIRSVYIHFFFKNKKIKIHDKDILPLIEKTLEKENPREWYFALMDYGAMLKKTVGNASRQSLHYKKQTAFKESNRKLRADILFLLHGKKRIPEKSILKHFKDERTLKNLENLSKEGFIMKRSSAWYIVGT